MSDADWLPLESSPEQLNHLLDRFISADSSSSSAQLGFTDIYSLDDVEVLFPFPVYACLLLFPITTQSQHSDTVSSVAEKVEEKVKFIKQYIGNACGSIAVLHSILNTPRLLDSAVPAIRHLHSLKTAHDRGLYVQQEPLFRQAHSQSLNVSSQRQVSDADMDTMLHFVCFVHDDSDALVELDGRFAEPKLVTHKSPTSSLLKDVCEHVKHRIASDGSGSLEFTLLALVDRENCMD